MPTRFYLRGIASPVGGAGGLVASPRMGRTATGAVTTTVAGATNIVITRTAGGQALSWFSDPITSAVTISGTVTVNIRGSEASNSVNAGAGIQIERTNNAGAVLSTIVGVQGVPSTITEYGTTDSARTGNYTPTSTNMAVGERIKFTVSVRAAGGTMGASTSGVTNTYDGPTANASGDAYIELSEDFVVDMVQDVAPFEIVGCGYYG